MASSSNPAGALRAHRRIATDDASVQTLMLDAAERCYRRLGAQRTRMEDVAAEAGVHRTTVYRYFANKEAVLVAAFSREVHRVLAAVEPVLSGPAPFAERLVEASCIALTAVRRSELLNVMLEPSSATSTVRAATASTAFKQLVTATLEPALAAAVAAGEVRDDVPIAQLLPWIWRVAFSLIVEPADDAGGDEGVLRSFLLPSLAPGR